MGGEAVKTFSIAGKLVDVYPPTLCQVYNYPLFFLSDTVGTAMESEGKSQTYILEIRLERVPHCY